MQAKDQLHSANCGRAVSSAARIIIPAAVLITLAARSTSAASAAPNEPVTRVTAIAGLEPGAIALTSPLERASYHFDEAFGHIESPSEGAGESVAAVLETPRLGNPQLEAAVGVVQFVFTPIAAGYGAITASHHKLNAAELFEAEQHLAQAMRKMAEQDHLRQIVLSYAGEKTHRHLVELNPAGIISVHPFSGVLETRVAQLQLKRSGNSDWSYQLNIKARARLLNAANDQILAERPYEYTSNPDMFIDWAREGGLESVAKTGFRAIAEKIAQDFFSPEREAPIFLGAGYKTVPPPVARPVQVARRTASGTPKLQFVDYHVTENGPFEISPDAARAQVFIRGPKAKEEPSSDTQTDAEWALDGLENHRNFVVQVAACAAAVPMGLWEQTVGAIGRRSQNDLSVAGGMVEEMIWKKPIQQDLANDIAQALAPQTSQPVILRKLPSTSGQEDGPIRISPVNNLPFEVTQSPPETVLEVHVEKVELCGTHGSSRRPDLSLEGEVTLVRVSDGQELCTWPVRYRSARQGIGDWSANGGSLLERELKQCSSQIARALARELLVDGYVAPLQKSGSAIAKN
jgi:hypothetical protein